MSGFINQLSNYIQLFTFNLHTVILLSNNHQKVFDLFCKAFRGKVRIPATQTRNQSSQTRVTGNKLTVYNLAQSIGLDEIRCVLWHPQASVAIQEKSVFPSFAVASTQSAFQTVWTLVLLPMPRNNKNFTFSSQPNPCFLLCFHFKWNVIDLRAEQLTRTYNRKIPHAVIFPRCQKGWVSCNFFFHASFFNSNREHQEPFSLHSLSKLEKHTSSSL